MSVETHPKYLTFENARHRLADPDGLCAKWVIDGMVKQKLLPDDSLKFIRNVSFVQNKIPSHEQQITKVTLHVSPDTTRGTMFIFPDALPTWNRVLSMKRGDVMRLKKLTHAICESVFTSQNADQKLLLIHYNHLITTANKRPPISFQQSTRCIH